MVIIATCPPGSLRGLRGGPRRALAIVLTIAAVTGATARASEPPTRAPLGSYGAARVFRAQSPEPFDLPPPAAEALPPVAPAPVDGAGPPPVLKSAPDAGGQVGCTTCGGVGQFPVAGGSGFRTCSTCSGSGCTPGHKACPPYEGHSFLGRFCGELYQSLCCPDPCYEPGWVPEANAAFFMDFPRPRTVQRIRNDYGWDLQFPDRNEFFWARQQIRPRRGGSTTMGNGPGVPKRFGSQRAYRGVQYLDYDQLSFYNEVAAGPRSSLFVEIPYRVSRPEDGNNYHAGFSDINFGTKGVIFDTELLLLTVQFKTYSPVGFARNGLGTGHFSLEPSLLAALKLGPNTYAQAQLAEWIPIGGDSQYQGSILHYHGSLNHVLFRVAANSPIIGTIEGNAWSFQDGAYTDPIFGPFRHSSGNTYASIGPGIRASICDAVDFGGAIAFPVTEPSWGTTLRLEFRILY